MAEVTYKIVQHDAGWAYQVGDVFSENFATEEEARAAAKDAAARQELLGPSGTIEWEDANYRWHREDIDDGDRPHTHVAEGAGENPSLARDIGADEPLPDGPDEPAR
jgi:hypothetical protein